MSKALRTYLLLFLLLITLSTFYILTKNKFVNENHIQPGTRKGSTSKRIATLKPPSLSENSHGKQFDQLMNKGLDAIQQTKQEKLGSSRNFGYQERQRKKLTDDILRQSIEAIHQSNFVKPKNESCIKRLPKVIVIGVHKCGTRELVDFLRLHPHIQIYFGGKIYEMHYFSSWYKHGVEWFKEQMPCSYSNQITVMKDAAYFHQTYVPERIHNFNESIKLILIVREPIARAYSSYTYFSRKLSRQKSFSDVVLTADKNRLRRQIMHIQHSVYDSSMENWLKYFNISQILTIESNELKHNPVSVLHKIERFLGIGQYIASEMFQYNSEKGFYCIRSNLTSTGMACFASDRGRSQKTIPEKTMKILKQYFKRRNKNFFKLIGRSFDW